MIFFVFVATGEATLVLWQAVRTDRVGAWIAAHRPELLGATVH